MNSTMKAAPSMKEIIAFMMLMLAPASTDMAGECDMVNFYIELGCTPVPRADGGLCPEAFTCPELPSDPNSCYYKGVAYGNRDPIPQSLITNPCSIACSCGLYSGVPTFRCAAVDCVETFDTDMEQQCINTYTNNSCCSTGTVCATPKTKIVRGLNIRNLTTQCVFGNMTLVVGDEVTVSASCTTCTCSVPPYVTCLMKNSCDSSAD